MALLSHPAFVLGTFRALWKELGGSFSGRLREGNVPGDARLLWTQESPPLAEVVRDINKFSNNVMARQLYLTLGSLPDATTPGNAEDNLAARSDRATAVIRNWLAQRRLNIPELVMENGSGLSRIERISAAKLGEVLNAAERVSVAQALKGNSIDAAWMCHADELVGSLAAGKAADFVFLGDDPLAHEADPDAVREIPVLATYSDGAEVHSA